MKNTLVAAVAVLCLGPVGCAFGYVPTEWEQPADAGKKPDSGKPDAGPVNKDSGPAEDTWQPEQDSAPVCSIGIDYGTSQCNSCMQNSCCAEDNGCVNDAQCGSFLNCMNNCFPNDGGPPDQQCFTTCQNQYPQGLAKFTAIDSCMQSSCTQDCR